MVRPFVALGCCSDELLRCFARALRAGARYLGVGGRGARLELDATLAPRLLLEHLADGGGVEVP